MEVLSKTKTTNFMRMSRSQSCTKAFNAMAVMYSLSRESVTSVVSARTLITVKLVRNALVMNILS